jgi:hypothetical protein
MESAANCAKSRQATGGTPLLESFDVGVGEQQCAARNVGLARLVGHEAQDMLDLGLSTAFDVMQLARKPRRSEKSVRSFADIWGLFRQGPISF